MRGLFVVLFGALLSGCMEYRDPTCHPAGFYSQEHCHFTGAGEVCVERKLPIYQCR